MVNVPDEQERLKRYLEAVHPLQFKLRQAGWPVETSIEMEGGKLVVWTRCDLRDTRVPAEYEEEAYLDEEHPQGGQ